MRSIIAATYEGSGTSQYVDNYFSISPVSNLLAGNYPVNLANESTIFNVIPTDIYIEKLYIKYDVAPGSIGSGRRWDITLIKNGVDTEITVPIVETQTENTYIPSSPFLLSKGDIVKFRSTPTNVPANYIPRWTFVIRTTVPNYYPILSTFSSFGLSYYLYNYALGAYTRGLPVTNVDTLNQICAVNGTLKSLYVTVRDVVPFGTSIKYTVFKNKIETSLNLVIPVGSSSAEVEVDIPVSKGDVFSFGHKALAGGGYSNPASFGFVFKSDVDGEFPLLGGTENIPGYISSLSHALPVFTSGFSFYELSAISYAEFVLLENLRLRDFFVEIPTAPGVGKSRSFTVYKNGSPTNLTFNISDTATTANNTITEITSVVTDRICYVTDPVGTPDYINNFYVGMGAFLDQVQTTLVEDPVNASIGCVDVIGYVSGGLEHLEGKEVVILADGEVIEGRTVISSAIYPALDHSYASVTVGLPYNSDLISLPPRFDKK